MRRPLAAALATLLVVLGAACGGSSGGTSGDPTTDKLAQIQARGTLVGFYEPDYPPQSIVVEGSAT